jgi:hypothetical protein
VLFAPTPAIRIKEGRVGLVNEKMTAITRLEILESRGVWAIAKHGIERFYDEKNFAIGPSE